VTGVSVAQANSTSFQIAYITATFIVLETTADKVKIINAMETTRRRLTNATTGTLLIPNCLILQSC
jgi:hypothetical protein